MLNAETMRLNQLDSFPALVCLMKKILRGSGERIAAYLLKRVVLFDGMSVKRRPIGWIFKERETQRGHSETVTYPMNTTTEQMGSHILA